MPYRYKDYNWFGNLPNTWSLPNLWKNLTNRNGQLWDSAESNETRFLLNEANKRFGSNGATADWWNSLSDTAKLAVLDNYKTEASGDLGNMFGLFGKNYDYDFDQVAKDILQADNAVAQAGAAPVESDYVDIDAITANAKAEEEALLNQLRQTYETNIADLGNTYNQSIRDLGSAFNDTRQSLLSQNYQRAAQLQDTYVSEMSKQRRNALEAGASAGLRIAGNINTMLSMQNKQSQQSLETSNQLAQMLLNQRTAEAGLRSDYANAAFNQRNAYAQAQYNSPDRIRERTDYDTGVAQERYDQAYRNWNDKYDSYTEGGNAIGDYMRARTVGNKNNK